MMACDWIQSEVFKQIITDLKEDYIFISLEEAHKHIDNDLFRFKNFAVLTADDGWASVLSILSWLDQQSIPLTLFLTPQYFDRVHFRTTKDEKYVTEDDLIMVVSKFPLVSFGMHGWTHDDVTKQTEPEFIENVNNCRQSLSKYQCFIPYFAYTWGHYNRMNTLVLNSNRIIPVLMDGCKNYNDASCIHREFLEGNNTY